jgi:ATP-dependent RNA helicase RhlE
MRQQNADLSAIELLVLDEADRMMDMGFWPDVRRIIASLPADRQTLLFSATMPEAVMRLAREIVRQPKYIQIGERSAPARTITHRAFRVPSKDKAEWLIEHLRQPEGPVLVFTRTKIGADRLARRLSAAGVRCIALHADRTMDQRRSAVEGFRGGRYKVLVATDIAARGLDIADVSHVINYDVPQHPEDYIHRIGRTGRMAAAGDAYTIMVAEDIRHVNAIERFISQKIPRVKLENFDYRYTALFEEGKPGHAGGGGVRGARVRGGYFYAPAKRRR